MGCVYFKSKRKNNADSKELIPEKKEYSWDKRPKSNPKDFTIENIDGTEAVRLPGTVNGKQFIIQNCKNATIYVLDNSNTITIDECVDCKIVLGPAMGSVFIRSCENCVLVALCGQFRARDCRKLTAFLCCPSQPALESCCKVRVGCCLIRYNGLQDQMKKAGLSPFNNQWNLVYDFTPVPSEGLNWRAVSTDHLTEFFSLDRASDDEELSNLQLVLGDATRSLVPLTSGGGSRDTSEESCLVIMLPGDQQAERTYNFIASMTNLDGRFELVEARERLVGADQVCALLQGPAPAPRLPPDTQLLLVGLHFTGHGCVDKCQQVAAHLALSPGSSGQVYVSQNSRQATTQLQQFMCPPSQA